MPVEWKGVYDSDIPGRYTFTAEFSGFIYASAHPYAVVTVDEQEEILDKASSEEGQQTVKNKTAETWDLHPSLDHGDAYLAEFKVSRIMDGTADFDTSDDRTICIISTQLEMMKMTATGLSVPLTILLMILNTERSRIHRQIPMKGAD